MCFFGTDAIEELKNSISPGFTPTTANQRYLEKSLGTWSSISDVDTFLSRFTHDNDYKDGDVELSLGNFVTIQDGNYNAVWMIAGFDTEFYQTSADGNRYDNGFGICMIPQISIGWSQWSNSKSTSGGYMSSYVHNSALPYMVTMIRNVLGSHIIQRNVLLSSSVDINGTEYSNGYTWTTAYATLMSIGQMTGNFAAHRNKYDDGEANYKLPIFDYKEYKVADISIWVRNVYSTTDVWYVYSGGLMNGNANYSGSIRPLIYLR